VTDIVSLVVHQQDGSADWTSVTASQALHKNRKNPPILNDSGSLLDVANMMIETHLHRALVQDSASAIDNFITQSDLLGALHSNLDQIDQKYTLRNISDFHKVRANPERQTLVTVQATSTAINAFRVIDHFHVSGVPVLDGSKEDKLVANLSARDVRYIISDNKWPLTLHQLSALDLCRMLHSHNDTDPPLAVSLSMDNTLRDVIEMLFHYRIHRVFILNQSKQVTHLLSIVDVLEEVVLY